METTRRLTDYYLPPGEGFVLESLVATTYQIDFEFVEEELLAAGLGVRSPVSRLKAFRTELERKLQKTEVSVLYAPGGCDRLARLSPRIDAIPIMTGKLHSKISLLMWVRENREADAPPDRRLRLIVGSANLTRQGFRNNYEYVAAVEYGGKSTAPRTLLTRAIQLVGQISAGSKTPQLSRQLGAFSTRAATLPVGTTSPDDPVALVVAGEVVPTVRKEWTAVTDQSPDKVTIVSPFWVTGENAAAALFDLVHALGDPPDVELVCRGERSPDGKKWLPVFEGDIAVDLKRRLRGRLGLRAALPDADLQRPTSATAEIGDESEEAELATRLRPPQNASEVQRALHGKMILLDGRKGSVLYIGSSNCTRRGLGLGGPMNSEAGFVYRLTSRQRKQLGGLLQFAGDPVEVLAGTPPETVPPPPHETVLVPTFLGEVVASGADVMIRFREPIPHDLVMLMPIPTKAGDNGYWLLYRAESHGEPTASSVAVNLTTCTRCGEQLEPLAAEPTPQTVFPHVFVEVRWGGNSATFPVRFDDKAQLPLLLVGRKPSEGELIDYFLFGKEPDDGDGGGGPPGSEPGSERPDSPIDTRRILAYFMRRFVQAIPGIEAEVRRAAYSRVALEAALRGPTSPLELAEHVSASLTRPPAGDEPQKTAMAVGFQLTEIIAALVRCQSAVADPDLQECFNPVVARCRELLTTLVSQQADLQAGAFPKYTAQILGAAP